MLCVVVAFPLAGDQNLDRPRYGSASDLRGWTRVFVDTGTDVRARERIVGELRRSGIRLQLVEDAPEAQILLEFGASVDRRVSGWVTNTHRGKDTRGEESVTTPTSRRSMPARERYMWSAKADRRLSSRSRTRSGSSSSAIPQRISPAPFCDCTGAQMA